MKAGIKLLSICPCGFPVLKDELGLGTEYEVDPFDLRHFIWICGGCGKEQSTVGVMVYGRTGTHIKKPGYLPIEIFGIPRVKQNPADSSAGSEH